MDTPETYNPNASRGGTPDDFELSHQAEPEEELAHHTITYVSGDDILQTISKEELRKKRMEAKEELGDKPRERPSDLDTERIKKEVGKLEADARERGKKMALDVSARMAPEKSIPFPPHHIMPKELTPSPAEKIVEAKEALVAHPLDMQTIEKDVASALANKQISLAQIAIAEQELRRKREQEGYTRPVRQVQNLVIAVAAVLILVGGSIALYYTFFGERSPDVAPDVVIDHEYIITPDTERIVDVSALLPNEIAQEFKMFHSEDTAPDGTVGALAFVEDDALISPKRIVGALLPNMPNKLVRQLGNDYMLGTYTEQNNNDGFIALSVLSYENAFAAMLDWEKGDFNELISVLSPRASDREDKKLLWSDKSVNNTGARVLLDEAQDIYLIYSFLDKKTLIITSGKNAFLELVHRYQTPQKVLR